MYDRANLTDILRSLQRLHPGVEPHLVIARSDPRLRGSDLFPCDDAGVPSLKPGTVGTCRISSPDGADGLHPAIHDRVVVVHLDPVDARRHPVAHANDATHVATGALVGGVLGAAGGVGWALLGAIIGGIVGGCIERRPAMYFEFDGWGRVVPQATQQPQPGALSWT